MNVKLVTIVCMLFSIFCCAQKPKFTSYSPSKFDELLKEMPAMQLVDVRRSEEFAAGHMDNAVLINVQAADFMEKAASLLDKSRPVAVYCRSGKRSKDAATKLTKEGFDVHELDTGYLGWVEYVKSK